MCSSKWRVGALYCTLFKQQDLMQTDRPVSRRDLRYEPDVNKPHNETPTKTEEYKTCPHTHTYTQEHSEKVSYSLILLEKTHSHKTAHTVSVAYIYEPALNTAMSILVDVAHL